MMIVIRLSVENKLLWKRERAVSRRGELLELKERNM